MLSPALDGPACDEVDVDAVNDDEDDDAVDKDVDAAALPDKLIVGRERVCPSKVWLNIVDTEQTQTDIEPTRQNRNAVKSDTFK